MKKSIPFIIALLLVSGCSTQKRKKTSTFLEGFKTYYNTLFNSKDALETELKNRKESFKDNYYAPYIPLLKYDEQPLGADLANISNPDAPMAIGAKNGSGSLMAAGPNFQNAGTNGKGVSILQIAEAKALKAIDQHSVMIGGVEKNKTLFDAYILLAQARLYMNKPLEALDAVNTIFNNMPKDKRIALAKVYQAQAYAKMEDFFRADQLFSELKDEKKMKKDYKKLASIYYSEMLLKYGKKDRALDELDYAFKLNKKNELRSRIAYLKGQIQESMGRTEEARQSFATAYKYARDFEFETKSQIEIAKNFDPKTDDYETAKRNIEKISKKGVYISRKNEFFYALGLLADKAGKPEEAEQFFRKSLKEKMSDGQIRGLDYYELGKGYFNKSDYLSAGAYYDSALVSMTYEPSKVLLKEQTENIKKVVTNYYLIKRNDSVLALAKMPEAEKVAYFTKYIDQLKEKEAKEELRKRQEERNKGFDTGDYNPNSIFGSGGNGGFADLPGGGSGKGGFYFANQGTVSKGMSSFKQVWGNRALADNWRLSSKGSSIEDMKNEALGLATAPDPRRHDPQFYIEKIPTDALKLAQLKKDRDTASLGLGNMYENFFSDTKLATKTLYDLVDVQPEEEVKLQALYSIFVMNYEKNPSAAERAKQMILTDFPYTSYAEYVKDPKNNKFNQSSEEVEAAYSKAFELYDQEKFDESKAVIDDALAKYPKDALVPKFALLYAFNTGKTVGKEVMILQLEQIALNYAKTPEGEKAKEMLKFLKTDLKMEITDDQGKPVETPTIPTEVQQQKEEEIGRTRNPGRPPTPPMSPEEEQKMQEQKLKELSEENPQNNPITPKPQKH